MGHWGFESLLQSLIRSLHNLGMREYPEAYYYGLFDLTGEHFRIFFLSFILSFFSLFPHIHLLKKFLTRFTKMKCERKRGWEQGSLTAREGKIQRAFCCTVEQIQFPKMPRSLFARRTTTLSCVCECPDERERREGERERSVLSTQAKMLLKGLHSHHQR